LELKMLSADGRQSVQRLYLESQYFAEDFGIYNIDVLAILDCCVAAAASYKEPD
jgi:hypothetical protein